jgi:hypothetical protein
MEWMPSTTEFRELWRAYVTAADELDTAMRVSKKGTVTADSARKLDAFMRARSALVRAGVAPTRQEGGVTVVMY